MKVVEFDKKIFGWEAIELKRENPAIRLEKYSDPIEGYKTDITLEYAEEIAKENPTIIFTRSLKVNK